MAKQGFKRNAKAIAGFLHNNPAAQAAVDAAAEQVRAATGDDEVFVGDAYHTDRYVRPVVVPADKQARYGTGTRATGQVASQ